MIRGPQEKGPDPRRSGPALSLPGPLITGAPRVISQRDDHRLAVADSTRPLVASSSREQSVVKGEGRGFRKGATARASTLTFSELRWPRVCHLDLGLLPGAFSTALTRRKGDRWRHVAVSGGLRIVSVFQGGIRVFFCVCFRGI